MQAVAVSLGAKRWVSVGHDWGSFLACRATLRFPESVAAAFSLSIPYLPFWPNPVGGATEEYYKDKFFYVRYFQDIGVAEAELERDPRDSLNRIFYSMSGDAPMGDWAKPRPRDSALLAGLAEPPAGPLSFMSDAELDVYAEQYRNGGFFGPLSWYRNFELNAEHARAYGDQVIHQPFGYLTGDKEIAATPDALEQQRRLCPDLRCEVILPGAGHWIQQERPEEVGATLVGFLDGVRDRL
jgi:pimeloyl-ACP methyl ester carboxylesterase